MVNIQSAFKVVVVEDSTVKPIYLSVLPSNQRVYLPSYWYWDGPFFLYQNLTAARQFAQSLLPRWRHLVIFRVECVLLEPQPKYFPAWFSTAVERLKWRGLVVEDVRAADNYLTQTGIAEPVGENEVLAIAFRLVGEPVEEIVKGGGSHGVQKLY